MGWVMGMGLTNCDILLLNFDILKQLTNRSKKNKLVKTLSMTNEQRHFSR